ncbi:VWA domain-containing protein, partial [Candidatus Collierbacteria bacterium]|nr:VWA domain-containing protein [Candidatus Collierbacteria bacterium]
MLVFTISLALLALAAAEPKLESREDGGSRTLNAIIVMDVSRSMLAEDGPEGQSRLEAGILAVEKLLETYPDGYFGLVVYTNLAVAYSPTFDHQAIKILLRDILQNYNVRGEGSSTIKAISDAVDLIEDMSTSVDTIILISDGGRSLVPYSNQPPLVQVVHKLQRLGVHLVTAGVGGFVPSAIPVYKDGELVGHHEFRGEIVYTSLEEP